MTDPLFVDPGQRDFRLVPLSQIEPPRLYGARQPQGPSVKKHGVLTPIELVCLPTGETYLYRVAAGSRRWAAACDAGLEDIPAFVSSNAAVAADLTGIENLCRSQNPVAEALALQAKLNQGYDLKGVAALWGAPLGTLRKLVKLLELPGWVLQASGESIALGVVQEMANLQEPYRSEAVSAFEAKLAADPEARFTAEDLKATRVAEAADLADVLEAATAELPEPILTVDPLRDLAARVYALCRLEGVDVNALARHLLLENGEALPLMNVTVPPVVLSLDAAVGAEPSTPVQSTPVQDGRPPARVRMNQWNRGRS